MTLDEVEAAKISFHLTCIRHRREFCRVLAEEGVASGDKGERLRHCFAVAIMRAYPEDYVRHIEEQSCMGCTFEEAGPRSRDWAYAALRALCHDDPLPPRVVKLWTEARV